MAQFYPEELIQEIDNHNDIVDIVSEYVDFKRRGRNLVALCPFHKEKTPSFSVSPDKQLFYCFGCGAGGNVINFIMRIETLDFVEAVKLLAERARIELPEADYTGIEGERIKKRELLTEINTKAAKYFYNNLVAEKGVIARNYFDKRKITEKTIKKFGLGYALDSKDALINYFKELGYKIEDIEKAGLITKNEKGLYLDKFRNRVIFPIFDLRGNIVAFGGRVIGNFNPKYLNSPETEIFNKRRIMYAMNFAKNEDVNELIIVEGYMDTISLHQHGIKNVVATMGTALSEEHARTISRYFKDVIISFDSDEAGKAAAIRGMDILLSAGCRVKILNLGEMKDPDDYIKAKGLHKFKKAISESDSVLDYRMKLLKQTHDINSLEGKIDFVNEIAKTLTKIENTIELDAYIQKISEDTKISKQAIYAQMKKISAKNNLKEKKTRKILRETSNVKSDNLFIPNKNKSNIDSAEEMLLNIIVSDAKVFNEVKDFIKAYTFNNSVIQKACDTVILLREKKRNILPSEILSHFTNKSDIDHIASILHKETGFEDNHKAAMQIINTINKNIMMDTIKDNINEGNVEKLKTLLQYKYKQS